MIDFSALAPGERVHHELMVRSREDKTTRNGDPFAVVQLGNALGTVPARVWKEQLAWIEGVKPGTIVQAIGVIEQFQGQRQLKLTAPLRVLAKEAVNLEEFLPRIRVDAEQLWGRVDRWRSAMRAASLRAAVDVFFADDAFRATFERTPGASGGHHAVVGGLLLHVVEVGEVVRAAANVMRADVDLVTAGALLHDIGKVEAYASTPAGFEPTQAGHLVQHVVLGSLMLDRRLRTLPTGTLTEAQELELHHFIQSQQPGRDDGTVRPMTIEAELVYWADQMSASSGGRTAWQRPHRWA